MYQKGIAPKQIRFPWRSKIRRLCGDLIFVQMYCKWCNLSLARGRSGLNGLRSLILLFSFRWLCRNPIIGLLVYIGPNKENTMEREPVNPLWNNPVNPLLNEQAVNLGHLETPIVMFFLILWQKTVSRESVCHNLHYDVREAFVWGPVKIRLD